MNKGQLRAQYKEMQEIREYENRKLCWFRELRREGLLDAEGLR
jgi:hypothetical protein